MHDAVTRSVSPWLLVALLLALISAWPRAARAQDQPSRETTVLRAARILDGRGEVLEDRDLVVRDGVLAPLTVGDVRLRRYRAVSYIPNGACDLCCVPNVA